MVHFPFADHEGAVQDLFDETNSSSRFYRMGSPARKKLIEKAFDEMCISRSKMRVVDIPEALKVRKRIYRSRFGVNIFLAYAAPGSEDFKGTRISYLQKRACERR